MCRANIVSVLWDELLARRVKVVLFTTHLKTFQQPCVLCVGQLPPIGGARDKLNMAGYSGWKGNGDEWG